MFVKLDAEVESLLCCSLCKGDLEKSEEFFLCTSCGLVFPGKKVKTGIDQDELVFDFRIHYPDYCAPEETRVWKATQDGYENYNIESGMRDSLEEYLAEIDSVREIYQDEFRIEGKVLDVGGHQGRLRHYLGPEVSLYVSADPYIDIFAGINQQPNLLNAYPCLLEPCNFISASAEHLPFKPGSFDWVHMRSVVDHFVDPYLAFLEAYRCCKVGGKLLVGLAIMEKIRRPLPEPAAAPHVIPIHEKSSFPVRLVEKYQKGGIKYVLRAARARFYPPQPFQAPVVALEQPVAHQDDHMFRLTYANLKDLFSITGWNVDKEHWQKEPYQFCLYASGVKRKPDFVFRVNDFANGE